MPVTTVPPSGETFAALVNRLRGEAVAALTALAGDASMCAIGRSGRSFPAAKYHEGRAAALGELRRTPQAGSRRTVAAATARWAEQAAAMAARGPLGPDWAAYFAGAQDALADVSELAAGDD